MQMNPNFGGGMNDNRPLHQAQDMNQLEEQAENQQLSPCPDCGKMFAPEPLAKHIKICKKVFGKKRKPFNSLKKRIADPEQASLIRQGQYEEKKYGQKKRFWN